jgi:predicted secreted Zn-dependent protease
VHVSDLKLKITINSPRLSNFTVAGKTLADAKKNLDRRDEWGLYDATRNFKSSAQVDGEGQVRSVTMVINPVIELPSWSGYRAATKEQKASWDSMLDALRAHENKHHAIQVSCVEALKKSLKAAKTLDASTLDESIEDQQRACQKKQDAYDSSSGHGAKEGVVLKLDA